MFTSIPSLTVMLEALVGIELSSAADYDGLVLPGGVANPDLLRTKPAAVGFAASLNDVHSSRRLAGVRLIFDPRRDTRARGHRDGPQAPPAPSTPRRRAGTS